VPNGPTGPAKSHEAQKERVSEMLLALAFFGVAACVGLYMAIRLFKRAGIATWGPVGHGIAAAGGMLSLLLFVVHDQGFTPARIALGLLAGAVVLGATNLVYHLRGVQHRMALVVVHALLAVSGVLTLVWGLMSYSSAGTAAESAGAPPPHAASPDETALHPVSPPPPVPLTLAAMDASSAAPTASAEVAATAPVPPRPARESTAAMGPAWVDRTIRFEGDRSAPSPDGLLDLRRIADEMKAHPEIRLVEVQGHADVRGDDAINLSLSRARAQSVVDALADAGVARSRLRAAGIGAACSTEVRCQVDRAAMPPECFDQATLARDRRVTFVVLEAGGTTFRGDVTCARAPGGSHLPL
jgi:outer membrane protein OmpA-like peptidoglycan-associated protein